MIDSIVFQSWYLYTCMLYYYTKYTKYIVIHLIMNRVRDLKYALKMKKINHCCYNEMTFERSSKLNFKYYAQQYRFEAVSRPQNLTDCWPIQWHRQMYRQFLSCINIQRIRRTNNTCSSFNNFVQVRIVNLKKSIFFKIVILAAI